MAPAPPPTSVTVLVADDDSFEADYVSSVLEARGLTVERATASTPDARPAHSSGVQAAVIGSDCRPELIVELERAGIPYLTLLRAGRREASIDKSILTPPFAAYQVADWVLAATVRGDDDALLSTITDRPIT